MKALLRADRYAQRDGSLAMAYRSIRRVEEGQAWCLMFFVEHPTGPFFRLSEKEYEQALAKYPNLDGELSASPFLFCL